MNADEFDKQVDHGENIIDDLDLTKAQRPGEEQQRVNADSPAHLVDRHSRSQSEDEHLRELLDQRPSV